MAVCRRRRRRGGSTRRRRRSPNGSRVSAPRPWWACRTAPQGRTHRQAKPRRPYALRSKVCAGSAIPARRSPPKSAFRRQLSAASSNAEASIACRRSGRPNRSVAMNGPPGRDHPHRHQKAGQVQSDRPSGHRRPDRQSNTRGVGWEHVHLAIDDHSRLAYSEILPDEKRGSCLRFLFNALRFFRRLGVKVERVMTDNGSSFRSRRYAKALRRLKIKHLRTKPYTPRTNGKAERFVQTSLREWAYARAYNTSEERAAELPIWLHRYKWHRPHASIGSKPPISRLSLPNDNLLRLNS